MIEIFLGASVILNVILAVWCVNKNIDLRYTESVVDMLNRETYTYFEQARVAKKKLKEMEECQKSS